ncbi:hypothetical protein ACJX0J_033070, partial [Zea mays]
WFTSKDLHERGNHIAAAQDMLSERDMNPYSNLKNMIVNLFEIDTTLGMYLIMFLALTNKPMTTTLRHQHLINFLANSPAGTFFLASNMLNLVTVLQWQRGL